MSELATKFQKKFYGHLEHPYRIFERELHNNLVAGMTILDAGCGRTAPVLQKYVGKGVRLIGVDLEEPNVRSNEIEFLKCSLTNIPLADGSVDIVISRSVMEHVESPEVVFKELGRLLKPSGHFIFLTPNLLDYASLISKFVPNRLHPYLVSKLEGREEEDVFPVYYRINTYRSVRKYAALTGFDLVSVQYLGQYPNYFMFNGILFLIATGYEKVLAKFNTLRFLRGWILVTLRKEETTA